MAIGRAVGTVTLSLVGAMSSSPPPMPPLVVVSSTGVLPVPPEVSISAANAVTLTARLMQRTRMRERIFFILITPFLNPP